MCLCICCVFGLGVASGSRQAHRRQHPKPPAAAERAGRDSTSADCVTDAAPVAGDSGQRRHARLAHCQLLAAPD